MARTQVPVTEVTPAKATLTTSLTGSNNDLKFTAKKGGSWGNSIQVEYIDPGGTTATLAVTVRGFVISVSLGRASSAINSTALAVMAAIQGTLDAQALVDVELATSNDGSGLVTALSATALAGGSYGIVEPVFTNGDNTNGMYFAGNDGQIALEVVSSDVGSQTVTIKRSPILRAGAPPSDEVVTVAAGATMRLGPFPEVEFNQNAQKDVYFAPSVNNNLDFRAIKVQKAT